MPELQGMQQLWDKHEAQIAQLMERVEALERERGKFAEPDLTKAANRQPPMPPLEDPAPAQLAPNDAEIVAVAPAGGAEEGKTELLYEFAQSLWDLQLFLGKELGTLDSALIAVYAVINIFVQICFALVLLNISTESVTDATLAQFAHWRFTEGHRADHYDIVTNTSLTRRVCDNFGSNVVSGPQQANMYNFALYNEEAATTLGMKTGPFICMLGVFLWAATVVVDLFQVERFGHALLNLYQARDPTGQTPHLECRDGQLVLRSLSRHRFIFGLVTIVLPRLAIDIALVDAGVRFLVFENTLSGLILNAVALAFILTLGELMFQLVPARAGQLLQTVEPVQRTAKRTSTAVWWRSVLKLLVCLAILAYAWFVHLKSRVDRLDEAQRLMCKGDTDFILGESSGTGFVTMARTHKGEIQIETMTNAGFAAMQLANLEWTGPVLVPERERVILGADLYVQSPAPQAVVDLSKSTGESALEDLSCTDQDDSGVRARQLFQVYFAITRINSVAGDFCREVLDRGNCDAEQFWRKLCPVSCGCTTAAMYNAAGCSPKCSVPQTISCNDITYGNPHTQAVQTYFRGLITDLEQQGLILATEGRTVLSAEFASTYAADLTGGTMIILNSTVFPHAWNLSTWLSGGFDAGTLSLFSPCQVIPLVFGIFGRDLCTVAGNLRDVTTFCPQTCGVLRCGLSGPMLTREPQALDAYQLQLGMSRENRVLIPRIMCSRPQLVPFNDLFFFQQPRWANNTFTLDLCSNSGLNFSQVTGVFYDMHSNSRVDSDVGSCSLTHFMGDNVDEVRWLGGVNHLAQSLGPDNVTVELQCHVDGSLSCGSSLTGTTAGAASRHGETSTPERQYRLNVTAGRRATFKACSQGTSRLSMWQFPGLGFPREVIPQDSVSTATCSGGTGVSLSVSQVPALTEEYLLLVDGSDTSFTVETECSFAALSCGDMVSGSTVGLTSMYGSASPEMIWEFRTGGAGGLYTFDSCGSAFDSDVRLYNSDMTQELTVNGTTLCGFAGRAAITLPANTVINVLLEGPAQSGRTTAGDYNMTVTCSP